MKLYNIREFSEIVGVSYITANQIINHYYNCGCKDIIKVGKRLRILDIQNVLYFGEGKKCQQNYSSMGRSGISMTSEMEKESESQLKRLLKI